VSFISKRRTALWVAGMERWATKEVEKHTEKPAGGKKKIDRQGMYYLGVVSAITIAKGNASAGGGASQRASMPKDRDQRQGLVDATTLLRNVLTSGRAPGRDYAELLSHPDSVHK
jgi:hypothetical protein